MANFNKIILVGNVTKDFEVKTIANGKTVAKFTLAVNNRSRTKEETLFIDIIAWEKLADICGQLLSKGSPALVEGRLTSRKFTGADGMERTVFEVVADAMQLLSNKGKQVDTTETENEDIPF